MLKTLVKAQLLALFGRMRQKLFSGKMKGRQALTAILLLYVAGSLFFSIGALFWPLSEALFSSGRGEAYFFAAALLVFAASLFLTFFSAHTILYAGGDTELLLSMPVKPRLLLVSRVTALYASTLLIQLLFFLPALAVPLIQGHAGLGRILLAKLLCLFLPLLVLPFSMLLGLAVSAMVRRFKNNTAVTAGVSLLFVALYMLGYTRVQQWLQSLSGAMPSLGGISAASVFFPFSAFSRAVMGDPLPALLFPLCAALPFLLVFFLIDRRYLGMLLSARPASSRAKGGLRFTASSPFLALLKKETRRLGASALYMLNTSLTLAFALALPVYLMASPQAASVVQTIRGMMGADGLAPLFALAFSLFAASDTLCACSVSLEGESLWIVKTLPVSARQWLMAKAALQVLLTGLFVLPGALWTGLLLRLPAWGQLTVCLLPMIVSVMAAMVGLTLNLRFPKLHYVNEAEPIKQSLSVFLSMLICHALIALPAYALFRLKPAPLPAAALFAAFTACAAASLYLFLSRNAEKKLYELN